MADDDGIVEGADPGAVARAMVVRIDHAIGLARAIGAERLAEILERAREAAEREGDAERSAKVH